MMTPEQQRLAYRADAQVNPAVATLRAYLVSGKAAEDAFYAWLSEPVTQMMLGAVEELADNPPVAGQQDVLVQYGVTSGLQLAAKLMSQPKRLFPEVFQDAPAPDEGLGRSYTANADAVIDGL